MENTTIILIIPLFLITLLLGVSLSDKHRCDRVHGDFYGFYKAYKYDVDYGCYLNGTKIKNV